MLALVAFVYWPSLANGFTYDDHWVATDVGAFLSHPALVTKLFAADYFQLSNEATYRPFLTATYMLDWLVGGGSAWAFHLQNLVWHLIAVGCLLLLLKRLGATGAVRYLSAAVYGVHPALTEAVDGVAFREDVLVTALGLLGVLLFAGSWPRHRSARLALGALAFAAAMLSKESGVVFALLVPLTRWVIVRRPEAAPPRTLFGTEGWIVTACAGAYLLVRFVVFPSSDDYAVRIGHSLWQSGSTGVMAMGYYLRLLVWPSPLCPDYRGAIAVVTSATDWRFWVSLGGLVGVTVITWLWRKQHPLEFWGWIWFLAAIAPVSNLVPIPVFMAERYLHLPFVGLVVCVVSSLETLGSRGLANQSALRAVAAGLVVVALSALTWTRQTAWSSNETLWRTTLDAHPTSLGALHGYGSAMLESHRPAEAVPYLERTLSGSAIEDQRRGAVLLDLGAAYAALDRLDVAATILQQAIAVSPTAKAHNNLAITFYRLGRIDEAADQWRAALRVQPDMADASLGLGAALTRQGKIADAIAAYRDAVRLNPSLATAHANLGMALASVGRTEEAMAELQTALQLNPDLEQVRGMLERLRGR